MTTLGERIKVIRGGASREQFAPALGVSKNTIVNYENDSRAPDTKFVVRLLGLHPDINPTWLLTGEGPMRRGEGAPAPPQQPAVQPAQPLQAAVHASEFHLSMGDSMELLVNIHKSGNNVLIRAINANLMAFNEAIENRERAETTINAIAEMREKIKRMEGEFKSEVASLREENLALQRKLLSRDDKDQLEAAG